MQKQQWRLWHCTTVVGMEVEIPFHSLARLKEVISNRNSSPSCINFQSRSSDSLPQSFTLAQLSQCWQGLKSSILCAVVLRLSMQSETHHW